MITTLLNALYNDTTPGPDVDATYGVLRMRYYINTGKMVDAFADVMSNALAACECVHPHHVVGTTYADYRLLITDEDAQKVFDLCVRKIELDTMLSQIDTRRLPNGTRTAEDHQIAKGLEAEHTACWESIVVACD